MDAETPKPGFTIDGNPFEIPTMDSFDLDEAKIFFDLTGVTIETFMLAMALDDQKELETLEGRVRDPDFSRAFLTIAYRREHPELSKDEIAQVVGRQNYMNVLTEMMRSSAEAERPVPLALTKQPDEPSENLQGEKNAPTGPGSSSASEAQVETLANIGT